MLYWSFAWCFLDNKIEFQPWRACNLNFMDIENEENDLRKGNEDSNKWVSHSEWIEQVVIFKNRRIADLTFFHWSMELKNWTNYTWAALEIRRKKPKHPMMALSLAMNCATVALWFLETELVSLPGMCCSEWAYVLLCSQLFEFVFFFFLFADTVVKVEMSLIPH